MGLFKDTKEILAAPYHYHINIVWGIDRTNKRFGHCAFYLHYFLGRNVKASINIRDFCLLS